MPGSDKLSFINLNQKNIKKLDDFYGVYSLFQRAMRDVMAYRLGVPGQALYFIKLDEAEEYSLHISDRACVRVDNVINELLMTADVPINPTLAVTEFASRIWDAHLI